MENIGNSFPLPMANVYYANPSNINTFQNPFSVYAGHGFSSGFGHPGNMNNIFNPFNMNNNENMSSAFPFHPHWQPPLAATNFPPHPQFNAQLGTNTFNPFSVNHLQTRNIPPVVTDDTVETAEQPSTSSGATPRHRESIPIFQARVCIQF